MEILSRFTNREFEVWADHIQYLDLGERHQAVPSGKSYIRGTFDSEQDAYVIHKIHIDPDMLQTDIKKELLYEARLQANRKNKRLLQKKRIAAMPKHEPKMRLERDRPSDRRPMITRDLQNTVYQIGNALALALRDPQGSSPGDARWTVSGLSRSAWSINHPDIMREGDSPLSLLITKITSNNSPDIEGISDGQGMNEWTAVGRNELANLSNMKILAKRKSPPGGDDWDDIEVFVKSAAQYFQEEKNKIMELKQSMLPINPPGAGSSPNPQQQQQQGGGMGGMMASRRDRRREAAEFNMTPAQAMNALQIQGTGDVEKDRANLRTVLKRSHPDVASGPLAQIRMNAVTVLMETFIRQNRPLPTTIQESDQGAVVGGQATFNQVNQKVQGYVSQAVNGAGRLQQGLSTPGAQVSPRAAVMNINKLNEYVNGAAVTIQANLGTKDPKAQPLYQKLITASRFLRAASAILSKAGPQINQQVLAEVIKNLNGFIQAGNDVVNSTTMKKAGRRASATLDNLRKAQRIASQVHRVCSGQDWYMGVRVVNDRDGIGLGVGARDVPPRPLRASLGGIPVFLEGEGARVLEAQREGWKHIRLARKLGQGVSEGLGIEVDSEAEKAFRNHQRLVKRVYNHLKNSKRLSGSVRYLARKLGIDFNDLVRVIGQLIVEGKIELTKKKKFRLLPEPHTPVPGFSEKAASTNSVFGIDRGRSDKRVDQLLSNSLYQLNINEHTDGSDAAVQRRDIREKPSKIMPDPLMPN
jgi:hypothetical protein